MKIINNSMVCEYVSIVYIKMFYFGEGDSFMCPFSVYVNVHITLDEVKQQNRTDYTYL